MTSPGDSAVLVIDIRSYWRSSTGRGGSGRLDSVCARDALGLPYLPGRHVKGLLRDAVRHAEAWGWYTEHGDAPGDPERGDGPLTTTLFGQRGFNKDGGAIRDTQSGILAVSNARLPDEIRGHFQAIGSAERAALAGPLFAAINSTAIEHESGTAKEKSLRSAEVAIPVRLKALLTILDPDRLPAWSMRIEEALPLIRGVGGGRSRGLGRAVLHLED